MSKYNKISKGISSNGLERIVRFTGLIQINLEDDNPDNIENYIQVQYEEYYLSPNGTKLNVINKSYRESGERATRWFTQKIPYTNISIGDDIIIPSIETYLTENLD